MLNIDTIETGSLTTSVISVAADAVIETRHLAKRVQTSEESLDILTDVNLAIAPGETVAIVGASGSGKSTLLGLLAGLDSPTGGSVHLAGVDLASLDEDGRAALRGQKTGFVFQSFQLLPSLTAHENVMLPYELNGNREAEGEAKRLLERVGLGARLHHYPRQLSGGEQQRVAIARAFAADPAILFADEPTGNLDLATGARIIDLLFELNAAHGTTLVLVTHDKELAARCDRRLLLVNGHLEAQA